MNRCIPIGWQTLLADLSIILFMITVAALSRAGDDGAQPQLSPRREPLAVYRSSSGAPQLGQWLASQPQDARQLLTIVVPYRAGGQAEAFADAGALIRQAGGMASTARIVIEPGNGEPSAVIAFDSPNLAQGLRGTEQVSSTDMKGPR